MLKPTENPPSLPPGAASIEDLPGRWWVAHTKARFEKAFAWDLLGRGIGYFLPMVDKVTISYGRRRRVLAPLFPSYVFFRGGDDERYVAMTTGRLCQTIRVCDQDRLMDELTAIERALAGHAQLDPYPFAAAGRRCRVRCGPFRGIEGLVLRRNGVARLVLEVSILGQGASMEIDPALLEPAE